MQWSFQCISLAVSFAVIRRTSNSKPIQRHWQRRRRQTNSKSPRSGRLEANLLELHLIYSRSQWHPLEVHLQRKWWGASHYTWWFPRWLRCQDSFGGRLVAIDTVLQAHTFLVNFVLGNDTAEAKIQGLQRLNDGWNAFTRLVKHYEWVGIHAIDIAPRGGRGDQELVLCRWEATTHVVVQICEEAHACFQCVRQTQGLLHSFRFHEHQNHNQ